MSEKLRFNYGRERMVSYCIQTAHPFLHFLLQTMDLVKQPLMVTFGMYLVLRVPTGNILFMLGKKRKFAPN